MGAILVCEALEIKRGTGGFTVDIYLSRRMSPASTCTSEPATAR